MNRLGIAVVVFALGALTCAVPAGAAVTIGQQPSVCEGTVTGQGTGVQACPPGVPNRRRRSRQH